MAAVFRYLAKNTKLFFFIAPLCIVAQEAIQGTLITGFNWRFLAHSQYHNLKLIQIADITGTAGISLLIALINVLLAELLINYKRSEKINKLNFSLKTALIFLIFCLIVPYGRFRLEQAQKNSSPGPVAAAVQTNIPSMIKELADNGPAVLDQLIDLSSSAFKNGADLVIWPETTVLASMNSEYLQLCQPYSPPSVYHRRISNHVITNSGNLLFGAHSADMKKINDEYIVVDRYNSAFLYKPNGTQSPKRYDKIHLVPFGEYVPFADIKWIKNLVTFLTPYDYDYNLTKGKSHTLFEMTVNQKKYDFAVIICYEDTDAKVTRKNVLKKNSQNKADFLVNISNDGWYVRYTPKVIYSSAELPQRTAITVFRAIENRISIIRSVNTGISCMIYPSGEIADSFIKGNLPEKAMERQVVKGWFSDRIKINNTVTFFTKHGQWLDKICIILFIIVISANIVQTVVKKKKALIPKNK
jgi:apolipoprotein N-acyltransferase